MAERVGRFGEDAEGLYLLDECSVRACFVCSLLCVCMLSFVPSLLGFR